MQKKLAVHRISSVPKKGHVTCFFSSCPNPQKFIQLSHRDVPREDAFNDVAWIHMQAMPCPLSSFHLGFLLLLQSVHYSSKVARIYEPPGWPPGPTCQAGPTANVPSRGPKLQWLRLVKWKEEAPSRQPTPGRAILGGFEPSLARP